MKPYYYAHIDSDVSLLMQTKAPEPEASVGKSQKQKSIKKLQE